MRVITGSARGATLQAPMTILRPTMDKVKAAIFSSLGDYVPNKRALDLFAGTGALGIEALSRGARDCTFVDTEKASADCIARNLAKARLADSARIVRSDVFSYLERLPRGAKFDLIFADPPYSKDPTADNLGARLLLLDALRTAIADDGLLVLETAKTQDPPEGIAWECTRSKNYGKSKVAFFVPS